MIINMKRPFSFSSIWLTVTVLVLLLVPVIVTFAISVGIDIDGGSGGDSIRELEAESATTVNTWSRGSDRLGDPAISAIFAWLVLVVTLEVNDFRHQLQEASSIQDDSNPHRHIASFVAIRLGLRDALADAAILYSLSYAVVAGCTWGDADPNSLLVIWGVSAMVSASILAVCGLKIPFWLGFYRKSHRLQLLKDTSDRATQAVHDLTVEGSLSITSFRYQARLGVGKHTTQFIFGMLPFYVDLKVWSFFISLTVGFVFGILYLFVVLKCRQKFGEHRGMVAIGASVVLSLVSALVFCRGMYVVNSVWNWDIAEKSWVLLLISFFGWLALCLIIQGIQYYDQLKSSKESVHEEEDGDEEDDEAHLFMDVRATRISFMSERSSRFSLTTVEEVKTKEEQPAQMATIADEPQEPLAEATDEDNRREMLDKGSMDAEDQNYYYKTVYFDRVTLLDSRSKKEPAQLAESMERHQDGIDADCTPRQIYNQFAVLEQSAKDVKCYHRLWKFLPFKAAWDIFKYNIRVSLGCCRKDSDFHTNSGCNKMWFVMIAFLKFCFNSLAIYVTLVACAATVQIRSTQHKLEGVRAKLYDTQNEGPVCAFDEKCKDLRNFTTREEALLANYKVAHCGDCSSCSTWQDMDLQYSTRTFLADKAQKCGMKTMFDGIDGLQACLIADIGWTDNCARCWAEDIFCTKRFCIFIYLQSRMTNQLGNFTVSLDAITSATCEEAHCEADPGQFVECSGSNRRRMNITSDIARPDREQCQIVDVEDWGIFFDPKC